MSKDFYDAATFGQMDRVQTLLATDSGLVHSKIDWGFTALHGVAGEEHFEMAELLLDRGADPNAMNDEGITPLHLAIYSDMVALLISRGADPNIRSYDGRTPLIVQSAESEGLEAMAALLALGAEVNDRDNRGRSALDIARARGEIEKIELLKRHGAVE